MKSRKGEKRRTKYFQYFQVWVELMFQGRE
jgi:hypothetical protein